MKVRTLDDALRFAHLVATELKRFGHEAAIEQWQYPPSLTIGIIETAGEIVTRKWFFAPRADDDFDYDAKSFATELISQQREEEKL